MIYFSINLVCYIRKLFLFSLYKRECCCYYVYVINLNTRLFTTHVVVKFTSVRRFNWVGIMWVMTVENCPSSLVLTLPWFLNTARRSTFPLKVYLKNVPVTISTTWIFPFSRTALLSVLPISKMSGNPPNSVALAKSGRQLGIDHKGPWVLYQGARTLSGAEPLKDFRCDCLETCFRWITGCCI